MAEHTHLKMSCEGDRKYRCINHSPHSCSSPLMMMLRHPSSITHSISNVTFAFCDCSSSITRDNLPRRRTSPEKAAHQERHDRLPQYFHEEYYNHHECRTSRVVLTLRTRGLLLHTILFGVLCLVYRNYSLIRYRRLEGSAPLPKLQFHAVSRKRKPFWKRLPDYGEINYSRAAVRKISREDVFEYETFRRSLMNQEEKWYPVPDPDCHEPSWKSRHYLTCNMMHEGDYFSDVNVQNVGSGFSRVAWAVQDYTMETSVLKMLKLIHNVTSDTLDEVHLDAIIMEELSSSPRIMDMHSFCGTSVIATNMAYSVLDEITPPESKLWSSLPSHRVVLRNRLSPSTKLRYALEMAESIADLHGRAIIHGDIHLGQWARKRPDDRLVLNDFNLAKVLSWNATNGKYCKAQSGRGNGNYRSPEEVEWTGLDEKIDVYSFGNNIFALLTGRTVSVENRDQKKAVAKYSVATNAFFKTKSFVERKLVEIMIRCWDFNPKTRPSIFDVVKFLRDTTEQDNMRTLMNVENEALLVTQH